MPAVDRSPEADPDKVLLGWLMNNLAVQPVRDTSMVKVSFESTDPRLAARITNAFAKAYIDYNLKQRIESTTEASQWLQEQLEKSQQQVTESVDALQQYREEAGLVDVEGMRSVRTEQLQDRTEQLSEAHQARSEAESLYQRASACGIPGQMDAIPAVLDNHLDPAPAGHRSRSWNARSVRIRNAIRTIIPGSMIPGAISRRYASRSMRHWTRSSMASGPTTRLPGPTSSGCRRKSRHSRTACRN